MFTWKNTRPEVGLLKSVRLNWKYRHLETPEVYAIKVRNEVETCHRTKQVLVDYLNAWLRVKLYEYFYGGLGFQSDLCLKGSLCEFTQYAMFPISYSLRTLGYADNSPLGTYIGYDCLRTFSDLREQFVLVLRDGLRDPLVDDVCSWPNIDTSQQRLDRIRNSSPETQAWLNKLVAIWRDN